MEEEQSSEGGAPLLCMQMSPQEEDEEEEEPREHRWTAGTGVQIRGVCCLWSLRPMTHSPLNRNMTH